METAVASLPDQIRSAHPEDHPLLEGIRAEYQKVIAAFGVDDQAAIAGALNKIEPKVQAFENTIATHLPLITRIGAAWKEFEDDLSGLDRERTRLAGKIYDAKVTELELTTFNRKLERSVSVTSKQMAALRKNNLQGALDLVKKYVDLEYVGIGTFKSFYASSYDAAQDDFGAAAPLTNETASGSFQWLRTWEFHIHGAVERNDDGAVATFRIKAGHIKPTSVARDTGTSIAVPEGMYPRVIARNREKVKRWAATTKGERVLQKQ